MANKHLHLNLKGEYFHAIRGGKEGGGIPALQ